MIATLPKKFGNIDTADEGHHSLRRGGYNDGLFVNILGLPASEDYLATGTKERFI